MLIKEIEKIEKRTKMSIIEDGVSMLKTEKIMIHYIN
jgi:hypothetical protein